MWPKDRKQQGHRSNSSVHLFFLCLKTWGAYPSAPVFPACSCQPQHWDKAQHCSAEPLFLVKISAAKPAALNSEPAGSERHSMLAASLRGAQLHTVVSGWALGEHTPSFPTKGPFPLPRRVLSLPCTLSLPCKHLLPLLPFKIKLWESHTCNFRSLWYPSALLRPLGPHQEH